MIRQNKNFFIGFFCRRGKKFLTMSLVPIILKTPIDFINNALVQFQGQRNSSTAVDFRLTFFDNNATVFEDTFKSLPSEPNPLSVKITIENNVIKVFSNSGVQNSFKTVLVFFDTQVANVNFFQVDGVATTTAAVLTSNGELNIAAPSPGPNVPFPKSNYATITSLVIFVVFGALFSSLMIAIFYLVTQRYALLAPQ